MKTLRTAIALAILFSLNNASFAEKKQSTQKAAASNLSEPSRNKTKSAWNAEPTSFAGVPFGFNVRTQPPCKKSPSNTHNHSEDASDVPLCNDLSMPEGSRAKLTAPPELFGTSVVLTVGNEFAGVTADFRTDKFMILKEALIEKYGQPHEVKVNKLQTNGGATLDSINLSWNGENVVIDVDSLYQRQMVRLSNSSRIVEFGSFTIATKGYLATSKAESKEAARRTSSGF